MEPLKMVDFVLCFKKEDMRKMFLKRFIFLLCLSMNVLLCYVQVINYVTFFLSLRAELKTLFTYVLTM